MTKNEIISIVHKCACTYDTELCNTQIMFAYHDTIRNINFAEVRFRAHNFLHFTGLIPQKGLSANQFYNRILHNKLSPNDFSINNPYIVQQKLKILPSIVSIDHNARMIGNFAEPHLELYTEKVAGTTSSCLGLIFKKDIFIPNTILNEDIRNISEYPPGIIFAIFKMKHTERLYSQLTYMKRELQLTESLFPSAILSKISPQLFKAYLK